MKTCAFLSMDNLDDFECYDHLLINPLEDQGWSVEIISWQNSDIDWSTFDVVLVRSPWDYQQKPHDFMDVLAEIDGSDALLENSLELIKWNINKTYLWDLQKQDVEIVPTVWEESFQQDKFVPFFDKFSTNEIIIKPTIGAGADDTFRIKKADHSNYTRQLSQIFADKPFMVQPFMENITKEGEFSVFFFGDTYSHTILKTPKSDDFRVQEEHGGRLKKVEPESQLIKTAEKIQSLLQPKPLYSRIDCVRTSTGSFALMELELIEPSLYFNMDPESPKRFAEVFDRHMSKKIFSPAPNCN